MTDTPDQRAWRLMCDQIRELQTRARRAEAAEEQRTFEVNALRAELIRLREEMQAIRASEDFSILPIDG